MWESVVGSLQAIIFSIGHYAGNSLGTGIFLSAFLLRVAFLPLTVRLARRARRQQELFARLQPRLNELQAELKGDPVRLQGETLELFRQHGYKPFDGRAVLGSLVQFPPLSAMYSALRNGLGSGIAFGWIPNLARPDFLLTILVSLLTATSVLAGTPPTAGRNAMAVSALIAGGLTLVFLLSTSSAMALSVAANGVVSVGQSLWLRQRRKGTMA